MTYIKNKLKTYLPVAVVVALIVAPLLYGEYTISKQLTAYRAVHVTVVMPTATPTPSVTLTPSPKVKAFLIKPTTSTRTATGGAVKK